MSSFDAVGEGESAFFVPQGFNAKQWRDHASLSRFVLDIPGLFFGTTTSRVLPVIFLIGSLASFVELYSYFAARRAELPEVQLPAAPFELTAPLLGLLLVFRTNSSYLRFNASSLAMQQITGDLASLVRQLLTWSDGEQQRTSDVDRIIDLVVQYHCWLCTCYLVPQEVQPEGRRASAALNARMGRPCSARLTPAHMHTLLSWEINQLPHLTVFQRKDMDQCLLVSVTRELARCEQMLRTPIPLAYTRSLLRFLWLWLTLLPFSLVKTFMDFGKGTWWEGQPLYIVPFVTCFIALLFLSLEDIAVQIEEPFFVQRRQLRQLAEWFKNDAEEMRSTISHLEASNHQQETGVQHRCG